MDPQDGNIEELNIESNDEEESGTDRGDVIDESAEAEPAEGQPKDEGKEHQPDMIPKARLNEVIEQRRAAEELAARLGAENEALRSGQHAAATPAATFDFDAKEQEAMDALMEGNADDYKRIRGEIRVAERAEASLIAEAALSARQESATLKEVASTAISKYPFLDRETGDEDAKREVIEWRDFYMAKGMSGSKALQSAVDKVAPMYAKEPRTADIASTDKRKGAAISRNTAASDALGPDLSKSGVGERATAGRLNVNRMSDDEFAALPDAELRKLRGD